MKRKPLTHAARLLCALALSMSLAPAALAADPSEPTQPSPCYPTAVTRSEDGTEIRKMYDLGPEDDPGGIPRSDFEQDGYHYTLTDLLKQELPANESRQHTETVSVNSKSKDMGAVLALLPIWLYNGKKGRGGRGWQYACYLFYPVHMLLLHLITLWR